LEVFRIKKTDKRMSAYPYFTHYIEENTRRGFVHPSQINPMLFKNFFTLREWLWEQFGASKEWRYWANHMVMQDIGQRSQNPVWCWDCEFGKQRIYLREQAVTAFQLYYL
jgi:hypothetical protein